VTNDEAGAPPVGSRPLALGAESAARPRGGVGSVPARWVILLCSAGCWCARRGFSGRRALRFLWRPARRWGLRGWCCSVRCS